MSEETPKRFEGQILDGRKPELNELIRINGELFQVVDLGPPMKVKKVFTLKHPKPPPRAKPNRAQRRAAQRKRRTPHGK